MAGQELTSALAHAVTDAENAVLAVAHANGGQVLTEPSDSTTTASVCGTTDSANASETDCQNTITEAIHYAGLTSANTPGAAQTVANVNTAPGTNGHTFEKELAFEVTVTLKSPDGATTVATRSATGNLGIIDACDDATECVAGTADPRIQFDGWQDATGNEDIAAAGRADGKCATTDPTCSAVGRDAGAAAGVQSGDSRVHRDEFCYDPSYQGNGGPDPGDKCNPTGDPNWTPEQVDNFSNVSLNNDSATAGNFSK
jgi:hypothetical protein